MIVERLFVGGPAHGQTKQGPEERQHIAVINERGHFGTYELTTFVLPSGGRVSVMAWKGWDS